MGLRVTTVHGLTSTYLESVSAGLIDTAEPTLGLFYRRTGDPDAPVECVSTDAHGRREVIAITMQHDCLSCLVREHTYEELRRIDSDGTSSQVVVTFPPGMDPTAFTRLVEVFQHDDREYFELTIDACVTVTDGLLLREQLTSCQLLRDWDLSVVATDERCVGEVAARQIEFADVVLIANADRLSSVSRDVVRDLVHQLNPVALVDQLSPSGHLLDHYLGLGLYNTHDPRRLSPLTSEYRPSAHPGNHFQTVAWNADRPLHPQRFHEHFVNHLGGVIRSRGQLWFASTPTHQVGWESSGEVCAMSVEEAWPHVPTGAENYLILIGGGIDSAELTAQLDGCLLTEEEFAAGLESWHALENPFSDILEVVSGPSTND